jgi:Na+/melibiose symporter-like transporter
MQKLSVARKSAYGAGTIAFATKDAAFINFVMFYYTQVLDMSGTLAGLAAGIAMASDAISDPIVGSLSDHHRSARFGRRHPFMFASILPLALCFVLIFSPPAGLSELALFAWLTLLAIALRTALTVFMIPYTALGAELSQGYEERSIIAGYRSVFGWVAGVALPAFAWVAIFRSSAEQDGRLIADNYATYGLVSAGIVIVAMAIASFSTLGDISRLPPLPTDRRPFSLKAPFVEMWAALHNRNFRWIFGALLLAGGVSGIAVTLSMYMNTYFWEFTQQEMAIFAVPMLIGSLAAFGLLAPLGRRFEKQSIMIGAVSVLFLNGLWLVSLRLVGWLPDNGAPILLWLVCANVFVLALSLLIFQVMGPSIVADIVDEYEVETGERHEGVFFAALGFSGKAVSGLGMLVGGIIIDGVGLPSGAEPGTVDPGIVWTLGAVAGPALFVALIVPLAMLRRVDLKRDRHDALRAVLDARAEKRAEKRAEQRAEKIAEERAAAGQDGSPGAVSAKSLALQGDG